MLNSYWPNKSPKLETAAISASRMPANRRDRRSSLTKWDKLGRIFIVRVDTDGHCILSLSPSLLSGI